MERWPISLKTSISLILNSTHPMWIGWGPEVTFFYNDAYIDVLSRAKHPQALGKPCSEVWSEVWDICGPLVDKVFQKGESSFQNDVRFLMNRGDFVEEMYYSFSYSPIRDESGNVGGLFCPTADVTPKVLNTRRLQTLSELAAKALVEKSTAGACSSAAAILEKNPDDIPFALLYLVEPDGSAATLEQSCGILRGHHTNSPTNVKLATLNDEGRLWPLSRVMRTGQMEIVSIKGRDGFPSGLAGQVLSQALVLPVISGGQNKPLALLVAGVSPARKLDSDYRTFYELVAGHVATAIHNAQVAEEEKRRADMLAELDRAKTTFFSNVSHEFRTPLTLMLGPLEDLLARKKKSHHSEDVAELEVVHRNSLRLLKLVNTLLDFSRIEAGRARAIFVETDLAALTTGLASVFRAAMEKAELEFVVDCAPLGQPVFVDRDMWEKIVFNLLSNAFKFTLSGGVEISLRGGNGSATLRVRDTGIGIPANELPNVFKRFHRIENARGRSHEGSGIGLALASELVKLHGGSIEVESEPGRGTVFQVNIPFGDKHLALGSIGSASGAAQVKSQGSAFLEEISSWLPHDSSLMPFQKEVGHHAGGTNGNLHRPRILVAEDNADMRDYVCRLLNQRYQVEAVGDGAAALAAARQNPPKLVLSDVMMPGLDGFGLLKGLRSDPATRDIPIILLSARAGEDAVVEGVEAGANDYLTKPFSARELMIRVAAHLEMDRMRKDSAAKIQQSEERYHTLFNTLLEGFCIIEMIFDENGKAVDYRFLEVNPAFEQQTGLRGACGKLVRELSPDHEEHWFEIYGRIALTGESVKFENEVKARNRWYKVSAFRVGGAESRKVAVLFDDISARKRAEEALNQNKERDEFIKEAAEIGFWFCDLPFDELHWDTRVKAHFWLPPDAAVTIDTFYQCIHPDDRERTRQAIAESIANHTRYDIEYRTVSSSGQEKWIRAIGRTSYDVTGHPRRFDGLTLDVTQRKEAEAVLKRDREELERLVAERTVSLRETIGELEAFSYSISHDMRAPLRSMQSFAMILAKDYASRLDAEGLEHLRRISTAANRMDRLIQDVLTYSRVVRSEMSAERIDLQNLLQDMLASYPTFQPPAAEIEVEGILPSVLGAQALVTQCVSNLIGNAVKFVAPGVTPRVRVFAEPAENAHYIRISFQDNGIGIASENHTRIFGIFERLSKSYDGTGIGLAIVKKAAEQMGGKVGLKSEPGKGSTFWLELRRAN